MGSELVANSALASMIAQGESKTLEFKVQLPKGDGWIKTLEAFANGAGGKLVIGIDDNRQHVGHGSEDVFTLMDAISSKVHDLVEPTLLPHMYIENISGVELLVVEVNRGNFLPYYLKKAGKAKGCYCRLGATNRLVAAEQLQALELQRQHRSYDSLPNFEVDFEHLDLRTLERHFEAIGKSLNAGKLQTLKLFYHEHNNRYPTHGLMILLGLYEQVETKCSRFKGTDMSVFLDKKEYTGDLIDQLQQAEGFIRNHLHLSVEIKGLQRSEQLEVPEVAIREALVNALVHRDYGNAGRDIKIGIYDDALNIVSPGGLPNGMTLESVKSGRSEIRNTVVARVLKELGFIEQWGSGIERIEQACKNRNMATPILTERDDFVDWLFPRLSYALPNEGVSEGINEGINEEINIPDNCRDVYAAISQNPAITTPQLAAQLGIGKSTAERHIKTLRE
ncbi:putative DNA binding domain-containing protein [Endozoicomonas sp.]|nr:putative DNA binding domain-containing protein [Endozoicomonas sp.]